MFAKLAVIATISLSLLAGTGAIPTPTDGGVCNTGPVQCCDTTTTSTSSDPNVISGLLPIGIPIGSVTGLIGLGCTSIPIVGAGQGAQCSATPVCCENVNSSSLIGINCVPVTL